MDLPQPPEDQDQKNIIDKLANFVARNGPEFEHMTKQKQKDNPKFAFLFGGEHYNYYQYKVTTEQAILNQHKQKAAAMMQQAMSGQPPGLQQAPWQQVQPTSIPAPTQTPVQPIYQPSSYKQLSRDFKDSNTLLGVNKRETSQQEQQLQQQIAVLEQQLAQEKENMEKQIRESEQNLQAHHTALMQVREHQIEAALMGAREDEIQRLGQECDIPMAELDQMAQPILEACTKENISVGKNWIFSHSITPQHGDLIALFLLKRVAAPGVTFQNKLHIMYLMNDVLHHCIRKNMDDLLSSMRKVVLPMCGHTFTGVDDDKMAKMHKLINLWEQHKYFDPEMIGFMRDPKMALAKYREQQSAEYPDAVEQVSQNVNSRFAQLQGQHQEFVNHLRNQVQALETSLATQQSQLQTLQAQQQAQAAAVAVTAQAGIPPPQQAIQPSTGPPTGPPAGFEVPIYNQTPPTSSYQPTTSFQSPVQQPPRQQTFDYSHGSTATPVVQDYNHGQGPPTTSGPPPLTGGPPPTIDLSTIDLSKPPPGFPPAGPGGAGPGPAPGGPGSDENLMPTVPYYDLPAGLMAPLVKTEAKLPTPLLEVKVSRPMPAGPRAGPPPPVEELLPSTPYYDLPAGLMAPVIKTEAKLPTPLLEVKVSRPMAAGPPAGPPPPVEELLPSAPYFDLPAGLMAPLIKLEDSEYKPLDPKDIRLPPPVPPSERLLAAVEAFYSQPTHERPRDSDGWEKLGLFEYYKAKEKAKKIKEEQKASGERPKSRTPSPITVPSPTESPERPTARSRSRSPPRRRYRSRSRSPSPKETQRKSRSRSRSGSSSRSRSSSSSRSRSRSRSRSSSSTPPKYRRRSRSRSRSATPPSFVNMPGANMDTRLGTENKGHQLLTKMGWGGAGLGKAEQGRVEPVESADVRDKVDQFKGIGHNMKDPFEQFRKNKAQGFIQRMRARDT